MPNRHSGQVVITCADWAYHVHHWQRVFASESERLVAVAGELDLPTAALEEAGASDHGPSRLISMVDVAVRDPNNVHDILPHILRVEAPALVVGDPFRRAALIMLNTTVLKGASQVWVDGHSACAGIAANCNGQYEGNQFPLQERLMHDGALDFANQLAINRKGDVTVHLSYTQFGRPGEILKVRDLGSVKSTVPQI